LLKKPPLPPSSPKTPAWYLTGSSVLNKEEWCPSSFDTQATESNLIRTAELIRNYMHDSIHAASFRSFAKGHSQTGDIFRYQYGFNFRRADGISYSLPQLTAEHAPYAINLNVLMDGLAIISVGEAIAELYKNQLREESTTELEIRLVTDIIDPAGAGSEPLAYGNKFNQAVARSTREFVKYWSFGDEQGFRRLLFHSMMSGDSSELNKYFGDNIPLALEREEREVAASKQTEKPFYNYLKDRQSIKEPWAKLFQSPDWQVPII